MSRPLAPIHFGTPSVSKTPVPGGGFVLKSNTPLGDYPDNICEHLFAWADMAPARVFLADRFSEDRQWRKVTFLEALEKVRALGQALLNLGASADVPLAILSDNSIENGLLQLASMYAGIPVVPISPAYSLISQDHAKLKHIFSQVRPGIVFVQDGAMFERALASVATDPGRIIAARNVPEGAIRFDDMVSTPPTDQVDAAFSATGPDTVAKILYTSGSTGMPKGVINPQRMLCANQQMVAQVWPFLEEKPPVIVDWLPWNHTFGGNHNFNMMLRNGGSLYIDDGKPAPGLVEKTIENFKSVSPTMSFNVPRGYEMLIPAFEESEELRQSFFKNLQLIFYAAAALPQNVWKKYEDLSLQTRGELVTMTSSWGSTETGPLATAVHFRIDRAGVIGNPVPGTEIKMVPSGSKLEMRVKGPSVTPGYLNDPEKTAEAFDEDGFYRIGDAGKLADPDDPAKGIIFDGRTAEDFKLTSGTWVAVGALRVQIIATVPSVIQDAVIAGHDRDHIGILVFPNEAGIRKLCGDKESPLGSLIDRDEVKQALKEGLAKHNADHPASSTRVQTAIILDEPPSIDANEITDKGYINQRAVLERRAALVERLFNQGEDCLLVDAA